MPEWTKLTDDEVSAIKQKVNAQFDNKMKLLLILSPAFALIFPYMPSKRDGKKMIDQMDFDEAFLWSAILWLSLCLIIWIGMTLINNQQFNKNRKFLRKKSTTTIIKRKSRTAFSFFYDNVLITDLEGKVKSITTDKEESYKFQVGDNIAVEYEEQTGTVFTITHAK